MFGEGTRVHMTVEELPGFERHLQIWMEHFRTVKMQTMFQEIQYLKNKALLFQFVFDLPKKHFVGYNLFGIQIVEQNGFLDAATVTAQQNGHFDVASLAAAGIPNPLTMQNQFNNCFPF
ncbi:MADS-box transcription factor [Musa troglodytarum]|uniref:MADS-box transcription factor n=1 Tax=Musa troglodytarum TaxID=320322 RepID=A0A9E7G4J9_9LILI|nr:MADS-box transcription factor [Musa troglodytarum]